MDIEYNKEQQKNDTDSRNIANLCLMCGKCCRAIATDYTHEELIEMSKEHKHEAHIFIDFFKQYDCIADARKDVPDKVKIYLEQKNVPADAQGNEMTFYYCDKLNPNNSCSIHKDRPICCRTAPKDGWVLMPPGCGYTGWQVIEKERIKENIRTLKEKIYE